MLTLLELEHYKCFERLEIPLSALTLLSGGNSSGKSSVLQALFLLHQTAIDAEWSRRLLLNGSMVELGSMEDIVNQITGRRSFSVGLSTATARCVFRFDSAEKGDLSAPLSLFTWEEGGKTERVEVDNETRLRHLLPIDIVSRSRDASDLEQKLVTLSYIGAERIGPRETYPLEDRARHRTVGPRGESAVGLLYWQGTDKKVHSKLAREGEVNNLLKQTGAWMSSFFPGAAFEITPVQKANLVVLGIRTSNATDFHRPQNVGYGLTHILPILVAGLAAEPGQIVVVENPEVHLHPAGQIAMGRFLCAVATTGVQVILETHSDHILNGVRLSIYEGLLPPEHARLHFFNREESEAGVIHKVLSPSIDRNGRIDRYPPGFFDEIEKSLRKLLRPARK